MAIDLNCNQKIFSLNHLAIITVSGADSAKFLQGQLTCDINALTEFQSSLAAFCNAKGRVITILLALKTTDGFLLMLPTSLLDKVLKKLQMYVLRSTVQISPAISSSQLLGLICPFPAPDGNAVADDIRRVYGAETIFIKHPVDDQRCWCIVDNSKASPPTESAADSTAWQFLDIAAGLPWFDEPQSELYTPHMLNIDGLGGISFTKGCYTGQEIVARTHYLGKAKRSLLSATCQELTDRPSSGLAVLDADSRQTVGRVLNAASFAGSSRLLLVLQNDDAHINRLQLDDSRHTVINSVQAMANS